MFLLWRIKRKFKKDFTYKVSGVCGYILGGEMRYRKEQENNNKPVYIRKDKDNK